MRFLLAKINLLMVFVSVLYMSKMSAQSQKQPNIIIIISDDHSYQTIGAYGSKIVKTPNIDRIAKEGALFSKAYVTNSICGPSRATILSGKYSHKNGFKDNENSHFNFDQDIFVKRLQKAGYQTAWIGKMHLGKNVPQGFDYYNILPDQGQYYNPDFIEMGKVKRDSGYVTDLITGYAKNWMDNRDSTKPFCLIIGHKSTHRVWLPDLKDLRLYNKTVFPLPQNFYDDYATREAAKVQEMSIEKDLVMGYDLKMFPDEQSKDREGTVARMSKEQRAEFSKYYDSIYLDLKKKNLSGKDLVEWKYQRYMKDYAATSASLDRNIGDVLNYVDQRNLTPNTIVIYLSDQGFYMGEHGWFDKRFMYEESFRTPMVMRYPGVVKPGTVVKDMVINMDIAPTVLEAAGILVPAEIQGQSFLSLLENKTIQRRDALYYHYYEAGEHHVSPHFGIKTKRYKLIRFYNIVNSWELFDLQNDPHEMRNIYHTKKAKKIVPGLKSRLMNLIDKYDDNMAKHIMNEKLH